MDLVPGCDLGRLVQGRGPLPLADACELARQAALGLQAVHEKGLVHRDIKPSNLMLTPDGVVKVLDLGLARLVEDAADSLTPPGAFGGTADYLAPEQASDLRAATIRSDLYSLGCTLYCLLAGRPPFGDDRHRSLASKIIAHREEPVAPITDFRPELARARELLRLLDRLLAKDPACRPAEPREVAEALGPLSAGHDLPGLFDDRVGPRPRADAALDPPPRPRGAGSAAPPPRPARSSPSGWAWPSRSSRRGTSPPRIPTRRRPRRCGSNRSPCSTTGATRRGFAGRSGCCRRPPGSTTTCGSRPGWTPRRIAT